jgi:DNA polymerase I-like protein with 3'-5' exonuclease and polymerase domains
LFGASAKSCSDRTGIPLEFMQQIAGDFWDEFKVVQNWIKARRSEYKDTGTITTLSGHVRRGIAWGNEPINHPIQMIEAYIVKEVLSDLNTLARREKNKHFLPRIEIHDDITLMLPNDSDLPNYIDVIQRVMVKLRYPWQIVPLVVDCSIGDTWGTFEKVGEFKGDYQRC